VFVFFTNLDSYVYALGGPGASLWIALFAACTATLVIPALNRPMPVLRSPVAGWFAFYFLLTSAWAIFAKMEIPEVSLFVLHRYRSIACLVVLALVFDDRRARYCAVLATAACVVLAASLNVAEFLSIVTFDPSPERIAGRSAGFYINPNGAGLAITMGIAAVVEEIPKPLRVPLVLLGAMGVLSTFSRGAMVCFAVAILWLALRGALGTWYVVVGAVAGVLLFSYAFQLAAANDLLNENTANRLRLAHDDSGRLELAAMAWRMFLSAPGVGHGLAATQIWGVGQYAHNMFLTLAAEQGILGLLAFPALGVALVTSNRAAACFVVVAMVAGLFSHDLLESRPVLLLVALTAIPPVRSAGSEASLMARGGRSGVADVA
jgi:O-antigen ligase